MKKLLVMFFALGLAGTLAGCGPTDITDDNAPISDTVDTVDSEDVVVEESSLMDGFALYTNSTYGFDLQYPSAWEYQEDVFGSHAMFFTPQAADDMFRENVGVITEALPADLEMTVDEYYDEAKVHLADYIVDFQEVVNTNMSINGKDAKKVQYLGSQGDYQLKWQQVFFIDNGTTYVMTYTALADTFDEYIDTVDKMVSTLTVK